jgi:Fur family transcriptional regulator, ferric uptake regulator
LKNRSTKQKQAIRAAFTTASRPLSPEETLVWAQKQHKTLGIATVYRNIKALVEDRWLVPVDIPGQPSRFELAGKKHHHHFYCSGCDKVYELEGCSAAAKPRLPQGFMPRTHEFYVFGLCAVCAPKAGQAQA